MNAPELCSTCRWFRQAPDEEWGTCHAEPPLASLADDDEDVDNVGTGMWPSVYLTDFCGSWRPVKLTLGVRIRAHTADRLARRKVRAKVRL